jgi:membrane protease YdiL (CAAX protease family)
MADETSTSAPEGMAAPAAPRAAPAAPRAAPAAPRAAPAAPRPVPAAPRAAPAAPLPALTEPPPRLMRWEIVTVFAVSLGASGIYALVQYIGSLTAQQAVSKQAVIVHGTLAPGRPLLDLFLQLTNITLALAPVLLVFYLLARSGERPSKTLGLDASQPGKDLAWGALLAAVIGGAGLGLYLIAYHAGVELNVVAENLPDVWWRFPVLVLSAAQNGILEEVVVVGYLLSRLDKLGVNPVAAIALSAVIRGSYHLYQGIGAFFGNAAMGVIFGIFYRRYGRVMPLIIAHTLIDAVTFIGYALLAGHVSWLPAP